MEKQQGVWMRFAVNGANAQAGHPWRCFIGEDPTEISLRGWSVEGISIRNENPKPAFTYPKDSRGMLAWVDYYGSYTIKDDFMYITLEKPTCPPPGAQ